VLGPLYRFCSQTGCPEGWSPSALVLGTDQNFYGTTQHGAANSAGTFFRITPSGVLTVLYSFNGATDGLYPTLSFQGPDGSFYGTAAQGGSENAGTSFKSRGANSTSSTPLARRRPRTVSTRTGSSWRPTETFTEPQHKGGIGTGIIPVCTSYAGCGTLFQMTPTGKITILVNFCGYSGCESGSEPIAPPIQATNGTLYGTTGFGGRSGICGNLASGCGTVFELAYGMGSFVKANPNFGRTGDDINILGDNLSSTTSVTFNGTPATIAYLPPGFIKARVPAGATTGTIEVTTSSGTLSSNVAFQVLP
jgi:uncharacterized repeat protein (TIGR03803 family)